MKQLPPITVCELIAQLQQCDPDAIVISTAWDGQTNTYCAIDHLHQFVTDDLTNDFFGTPGEIDRRVLGAQSKHVVCIDSLFSYTAPSQAEN